MNIGPAEIFVILVFALLITGPERLPKFGSALGKAIYNFRSAQNKVAQTLEQEGLDLKNTGESSSVSRGLSDNPFLSLGQSQKNNSNNDLAIQTSNPNSLKQTQSSNLEGGSGTT